MDSMNYIGTRGEEAVSASRAILKGIGENGGLYVPERLPDLSRFTEGAFALGYRGLSYEILKVFLTDFTDSELRSCIDAAYDAKFESPLIAPVETAGGGDAFFLELFRGPTLAFKDMALSILPHFMKTAARKTGLDKKILILTATSGDTGKAALEGFKDVADTCIAVFYPENGVSDIQKLQMTTQDGNNTYAAAIKGNFDDAQTAVKRLFTSPAFNEKLDTLGYTASSANSINIGRLLPQIIYYFWAYAQMRESGAVHKGERINFTVPTGNFGNILAGYYAAKMGLPAAKLICASNENRILTDFFQTGEYDANRDFYPTISPSMDILISSNLERLLYDLSDTENVKTVMDALKFQKRYSFPKKSPLFEAAFADTEEALAAIGEVSQKGYIMDPHTAVGCAAYKKYTAKTADQTKNVFLATASPYKFAEDVLRGLGRTGASGFSAVRALSDISKTAAPARVTELETKPVRHTAVLSEPDMEAAVLEFIKSR